MIEGSLYVFSLPRGADKATVSEAIEKALEATSAGRVLGSGTSIADGGTVAVDIGAYDRDAAHYAISRACRRLKCWDFEVAWD